eukprot:CAMPEP_0184544848 /NCGR_PEP_ID=MMETSP0199_2-20130426/3902_1 /TAXON_ID=1112570 /ORGANISM="Thraustochytrium sp., Strain LLF1b" /LENGTH=69 /DNA_ID=CAMNT_0026939079 /DNA_START=51 /DNA_END=260 /DNA_ORIENTATION=-
MESRMALMRFVAAAARPGLLRNPGGNFGFCGGGLVFLGRGDFDSVSHELLRSSCKSSSSSVVWAKKPTP